MAGSHLENACRVNLTVINTVCGTKDADRQNDACIKHCPTARSWSSPVDGYFTKVRK